MAPFKERVHPLHGDLCVEMIQDILVVILAKNYEKIPKDSEQIGQNEFGFQQISHFPSNIWTFGPPLGVPHILI